MTYRMTQAQCQNYELSSRREWLLTNGLGGYAMGTVAGANTRRYHGHLVAATVPPTHRTVLLGNIEVFLHGSGTSVGLSTNQYHGTVYPEGYQYLKEFTVDDFVQWVFASQGMELVKTLQMHDHENAVTLRFANTGSKQFGLTLRPLVQHKYYHDNFHEQQGYPQVLAFPKDHTVLEHGGVPLVLHHEGAQRLPTVGWYYRFECTRELERGLDPSEDMFCPCELNYELMPGEEAVVVASTDDRSVAAEQPARRDSEHLTLGEELAQSARKYFVSTSSRHSILAGLPWFGDWGRDTMICIPGLCLATGRIREAKRILRDYGAFMRDGLIPNHFVDRESEPEYNTADATLWYANAIHETLAAEWDQEFAEEALSKLQDVYDFHVSGTRYGIRVDPNDGLLTQGADGVQLTWMDAKIGDWVVTPRHGKPVEVNGLWVNALRIMEQLAKRLGRPAEMFTELADRAERSFDQKFWSESLGHYLDCAEPDDASFRPNQLIAMSLPYGPATGEHARRALDRITKELLTPVGLRTLGPNEPQYKGAFRGPLAELDAAYHQGTVWPWLIGPYVFAALRLGVAPSELKALLKPFRQTLTECGLGGISEVYDGDEPRAPGGCPFQAWNVAEVLRAWKAVGGN
jgi:predicted glycogen debranching enzyme